MSWVASGHGGFVYALGDAHEFRDVPLESWDAGWTWSAPPQLRLWESTPAFELFEGGVWLPVEPELVYVRSGAAVFPRCLTGFLRASGVCFPTSVCAEVGRWKVVVESVVRSAEVMGSEQLVKRRQLGATASLDVKLDSPGPFYTWFPHGRCVIAGVGETGHDMSQVVYDEKGVSYDPCCH